jgi:hypothetical protein
LRVKVTGVHTIHLASLTGVPHANLTGMCWDGTNVYGVSTSITASQIFTINWTTGVCTPIGSPQSNIGGAINLMGRLGTQYRLFSCDIVLDNLYWWNKATGIATVVGPHTPANFGQDGNVDPNDNKFYWMAYTTSANLRILDTATGAAHRFTLIQRRQPV